MWPRFLTSLVAALACGSLVLHSGPAAGESSALSGEPAAGATNSSLPTARASADGLPVLTTAAEVGQLKREEAQRGYPARLQGVVVCVVPERPAFILQDATRAVYVVVDLGAIPELPPVGTGLVVEGQTDKGSFAPILLARNLKVLGSQSLPEPMRPSWDQLMNGSLDDQWVEIKGLVQDLAAGTNTWSLGPVVRLRMPEGTLQVDFRMAQPNPEPLERCQGAVVRLRGCLFITWDPKTGQVKKGLIRMIVRDIIVDEPAPTDLFATPKKTAPELMLFDPHAGAFQRVRVSGQIIQAHGLECFMMDGTNGVRFVAKAPARWEAGDEVEVVGFPELSGAAPVLQEAVARKTGHAVLPEPRRLLPDELMSPANDSTRVRVEGLLANLKSSGADQVLEMQAGYWKFLARLSAPPAAIKSLRIGSRLGLTGVYAADIGTHAPGEEVTPFALLLGTPADIIVLEQPSWWTLRRMLVVVGALVCVLAVTLLWITLLHRKVEQRSTELTVQIQERERAEQLHAIEQERARIAQDLHDQLGSDITEVGMLAARAKSISGSDDERGLYLDQMGSKTRQMVAALEEIVWAMNPMRDSLASLVSYFRFYAERFLDLANIKWQFEGPPALPDRAIDARLRHQLFLAFKEALANVARHSGATEVRLSIGAENGELRLVIADNGQGLPPGAGDGSHRRDACATSLSGDASRRRDACATSGNGLANMRARIESLGGRFELVSEAGRGTTLRLSVPAP